ncbi:MAG: hypothetical protein HWN65_15135 [Candidatus Helarchaeota archaeon]|nr:hypothetical protein [Candidatus Helarchaeota archaeon]
MPENGNVFIMKIVSIALLVFSIIICPMLISISFFMRKKIDQAFKTYGRDETFKLINIMGVFGVITILLNPPKKKISSKE